MKSNRMMQGIYQACEAVTQLAYLHVLWVFFSIIGLGIFGIFPATIAVFTVIRQWFIGHSDVPVFKTFWQTYKENFLEAQIIGFVLAIFGAVLYVDYQFFAGRDGALFGFINILTGSAIFVYAMVVMYIFPVFSHYKLKTLEYIKNALLIGLSHLFYSIIMIVGAGILFYMFLYYSGLLVVFGLSIFAYWITWIAMIVFKRLEKKKQSVEPENV